MQPGDLRRFKGLGVGSSLRAGVFVVLARYDFPLDAYLSVEKVDVFLDGGIKTGWSSSWVEDNSEVLDVVE